MGAPNSFAVQIRRALEAICVERGKLGRNLNQDLTELAKDGVFPPILADIAHELRRIGNAGAHSKDVAVLEEQVPAIDDFFHLQISYVYDARARLEQYRKHYTPDLPEVISEDAVN